MAAGVAIYRESVKCAVCSENGRRRPLFIALKHNSTCTALYIPQSLSTHYNIIYRSGVWTGYVR